MWTYDRTKVSNKKVLQRAHFSTSFRVPTFERFSCIHFFSASQVSVSETPFERNKNNFQFFFSFRRKVSEFCEIFRSLFRFLLDRFVEAIATRKFSSVLVFILVINIFLWNCKPSKASITESAECQIQDWCIFFDINVP